MRDVADVDGRARGSHHVEHLIEACRVPINTAPNVNKYRHITFCSHFEDGAQLIAVDSFTVVIKWQTNPNTALIDAFMQQRAQCNTLVGISDFCIHCRDVTEELCL